MFHLLVKLNAKRRTQAIQISKTSILYNLLALQQKYYRFSILV